jgi:hypothetical protein
MSEREPARLDEASLSRRCSMASGAFAQPRLDGP